jgi:hypothetical protein
MDLQHSFRNPVYNASAVIKDIENLMNLCLLLYNEGNGILWVSSKSKMLPVAANAEQNNKKNLNKWPHKSRRILRNDEEVLRLCDIRGNGK